MENETYFKGQITKINNSLETYHQNEIIYRIINFNNIYFFAEEISTGCIFPTYAFSKASDDNKKDYVKFRSLSYVSMGKYYVFLPLAGHNEVLKYCLNETNIKKGDPSIATLEEVKKYLDEKKDDESWKKEIQDKEDANQYLCDLDCIKNAIAKLKEGNNVLNITEFNPNYERYIPTIDTEEVSELGFDLSTKKDLCCFVEREEEKKKVIKEICINKNSCLIVGPSDSGKTSIVEGIADDIKNKNNEWLKDKIIFKLDTISEETINKLIKFCKKYPERVILFVDDINLSFKNYTMNIMNILEPYIINNTLTVIGTILKSEYESYLKEEPAFIKKISVVEVSHLTIEMNINIIIKYIETLEKKYNIKLELEEQEKYKLAQYIVTLSDYNTQKKSYIGITSAKNIIKDAFAETIYNKKTLVTFEEIYFAILSCNKLSLELRREKAEELKENITMPKEVPVQNPILIKKYNYFKGDYHEKRNIF